jgi:RNA-directed DNA polymerase
MATGSPIGKVKKIPQLRWVAEPLRLFLEDSLKKLQAKKRKISENSPWWSFIHTALQNFPKQIEHFMAGEYRFEPMQIYNMPDESVLIWQYGDRLFVRTLLALIKPLFKHIVSPLCFHLKGPNGVKSALGWVKKGLEKENFRYFLRIDIAGYYASIDRKILVSQMKTHFNDRRMLSYLESIITISEIKNGGVFTPTTGIARRSSLSPFFGALYLSPLDRAFENKKGICYCRYMDDILILCETKLQFTRAKKQLKKILIALRLKYSRHKTKMGVLNKGFHFLGIDFKVEADVNASVSAEKKQSATRIHPVKSQLNITLHTRSSVRALGKIIAKKEDAVHPAEVQAYLLKWANWWFRAAPPLQVVDCLKSWVNKVEIKHPDLASLGTGLCVNF